MRQITGAEQIGVTGIGKHRTVQRGVIANGSDEAEPDILLRRFLRAANPVARINRAIVDGTFAQEIGAKGFRDLVGQCLAELVFVAQFLWRRHVRHRAVMSHPLFEFLE